MIYLPNVNYSSFHFSGDHINFGESKPIELVSSVYDPPYETLRGAPEITFSVDGLDMYIWSPVK